MRRAQSSTRTEFAAGYALAAQHIGAGAMDVLHVSSALRLQAEIRTRSLIVASSDRGFLALARAVGLRTLDPETATVRILIDLSRPGMS